MNNNLVMIPFAFDTEHMASCSKSDEKSKAMYLQCICVSCISAKKNSGADVALITNIDIDIEYKRILEENGVKIIKLKFSNFRFDTDKLWYLAFYKLNALYRISRMLEYDNYCYLDTDVFVQHDFAPIWKECSNNILLYDINHGYQVNDYRIITEEFKQYFGEEKNIVHYGGEFFAASRENAIMFSETCLNIFNRMQNEKISTTKGDEFILSIAAYSHLQNVKNAGAYVYRYWTGNFYLVSTNYKYNPVCILHLPAEKNKGIVKIYKDINNKKELPSKRTVWKYCHLTKRPLLLNIKKQTIKFIEKI